MKCGRKVPGKNITVDSTWEVHLTPKTWNKIKEVAEFRNKTYSWISRYCVFRLAKRKNLRKHTSIERAIKNIREEYKEGPQLHRHVICLYGKDEVLIKMAAHYLGLTVSMLVRLALQWFLHKICHRVSADSLYANGVKLVANIFAYRTAKFGLVETDLWKYQSFPKVRPPNSVMEFHNL